jgi:hypothetical protein
VLIGCRAAATASKDLTWSAIPRVSESSFPTDEQRAAGDFEIGYACLFCGEQIAESGLDFCQITVEARGGYAAFTAHTSCLRRAAYDPDHFPDIETPAEPPPGYEPPSQEFLDAWDDLAEVLAQLHHADLENAEQVRSLMQAVQEAATRHGVDIEVEEEQG